MRAIAIAMTSITRLSRSNLDVGKSMLAKPFLHQWASRHPETVERLLSTPRVWENQSLD